MSEKNYNLYKTYIDLKVKKLYNIKDYDLCWEGVVRMKKILAFFTVLVIVVFAFAENFAGIFSAVPFPSDKKKPDREIFSLFSAFTAADVEKTIREEEKKRKESIPEDTKKKLIEETLKKLKNGKISLRKVFSSTCFVGDSLLNGLEVYNILSADKLITEVSARLDHLEDNIKKITKTNPEVLVLHYGLNMLWEDETGTQWFIDDYSTLIKKIKKALPYTRIIVSGIFPVDTEIVTDEIFSHIPRHNTALKKMCKDIGVEFLDSTALVEECAEYYGPDGIHFVADFYSEKWLPYIVENKGITG